MSTVGVDVHRSLDFKSDAVFLFCGSLATSLPTVIWTASDRGGKMLDVGAVCPICAANCPFWSPIHENYGRGRIYLSKAELLGVVLQLSLDLLSMSDVIHRGSFSCIIIDRNMGFTKLINISPDDENLRLKYIMFILRPWNL